MQSIARKQYKMKLKELKIGDYFRFAVTGKSGYVVVDQNEENIFTITNFGDKEVILI